MRPVTAAGALLAAWVALSACTGGRGASDVADEPTSGSLQARQLKRAYRAASVLTNTTTLQLALFQGAMGNPIGDAALALQKALEAKKDAKAADVTRSLDDVVKDLSDDTGAAFAALVVNLGDPFKGLKPDERRELARAFAHKELQRGATLAGKDAPKPLGLPQLTRLLRDGELERYVLLLSLPDPKQDDVRKLQAWFRDLTAWLADVNERAKEDKDLERAVEAASRAKRPLRKKADDGEKSEDDSGS